MAERTAVIRNGAGIHCRPSAVIVKAIRGYAGSVLVHGASGDCDPRSIMALLGLGLQHGDRVTVSVSGPDEDEVCKMLADLFETAFDFPPRPEGTQAPIPADLASGPGKAAKNHEWTRMDTKAPNCGQQPDRKY
jgi:phosphocarrier protein HPr